MQTKIEEVVDFISYLKWSSVVEINRNYNFVTNLTDAFWKEQWFFCCWLWEKKYTRCKNEDIVSKSYFVVDLDIRLSFLESTGKILSHEELLEKINEVVIILEKNWFNDYSYSVMTGNWLHLYFSWTEQKFDKDVYFAWVWVIFDAVDNILKETPYRCDTSMKNIARLSRIPWTLNPRKKHKTIKETKEKILLFDLWNTECYIIKEQKQMSMWFGAIKGLWEKEIEEQTKKKYEMEQEYFRKSLSNWTSNVFDAICLIPLNDIICEEFWFEQRGDSKLFYWWKKEPQGLLYFEDNNVVIHKWCSMRSRWKCDTTYNTFSYIMAREGLDKAQTFKWFIERYSDIKKINDEWLKTWKESQQNEKITKPKKIEKKISTLWEIQQEKEQQFDGMKDVKKIYKQWITVKFMVDELNEKLKWIHLWTMNIIVWSPNSWKAQPLYSKVLTPEWYKTMWEINTWDYVIWIDWEKKKVLFIPSYWEQNIYRIYMSDWSYCDAWEFHEFRVAYTNKSKSCHYDEKDIEVHKIKSMLEEWYWFRLPLCNKFNFCVNKINDEDLDPYTLWVLIWDWCLSTSVAKLSCSHDFILNKIKLLWGDNMAHIKWCDYRISRNNRKWLISWIDNTKSFTYTKICELWLDVHSYNKFIPKKYLLSSLNDRISLLNWLMDTDWEVMKWKNKFWYCYKYWYSTSSKQLCYDMCELVKSLWWNYRINTKTWKYKKDWVLHICRLSYIITFSLPDDIQWVTLPSKRRGNMAKRRRTLKIVKIEYIWRDMAKCISVEWEMYITDWYIPTHNTTFAYLMMNYNIAQWLKVWFLSYEMAFSDIMEQYYFWSIWAMDRFMEAKITDEDEQKTREYKKKLVLDDHFFHCENLKAELEDLKSDIEKMITFGAEAVFIDNLIKIRRTDNEFYDNTKVIEYLYQISKSSWIAIILLHHTDKNWAVKNTLSFRGTGDVQIKPDNIFYLKRPSLTLEKDSEMTRDEKAELVVMKSKQRLGKACLDEVSIYFYKWQYYSLHEYMQATNSF